MRENYRLMSSLATETRLHPGKRIEKLLSFNDRLCKVPAIMQELSQWNLELDRKLVEIDARELPVEKINFRPKQQQQVYITPERGDWTRSMQNKECVSAPPLHDWILMITERDKGLLQVSNIY